VTIFLTVVAGLLGAILVAVYFLWDFAADRLLASLACGLVRAITFGRVRLSPEEDFTRAMGISAITLIVVFVAFAIIASRVH